jgi:ABC-type amino acid transport substrate-binding protein
MHRSLLSRWARRLCGVSVAVYGVTLIGAAPPPGVLDTLRTGSPLLLGYRADARPFAYRDEGGQPAGYSVALCERVFEAVKAEPGLAGATATWVPVTADDRFRALEQGKVHILCGADSATPERKSQIAFSIPIFPGGIGVLVRRDAPTRLRELLLTGRGADATPESRTAAEQTLLMRGFAAVTRTTSEAWLRSRIKDFGVMAFVLPADSFDAGVQQLLGNKSDAFFAERAMLLDTVQRHASRSQLSVIDRLFTQEALALALPRDDEAWRQLVDRELSRLYASGEVTGMYTQWFGAPDEFTREFFRTNIPSGELAARGSLHASARRRSR